MPKTRPIIQRDLYLELVSQFPLRPLRNESRYSEARKMFTRTSLAHQNTRDTAIIDYLDILAGLIDQYEVDANLKMDLSHVTPADVIRHLMENNGLSVSGLAKQIGLPQSNLSEMLSGKRDFSKAAISKLCDRFKLGPQLFFPNHSSKSARR